MQFVWKVILLISLSGLTACNDDSTNTSAPPSNQNGNSLAAIDSDNDGIKDSLDCAPQDVNRWQQLSYQFQDQDQDGHLISFPQVNTICSGLQLPTPYVASALGMSVGDCDDSLETGVLRYRSVNLYTDSDQDKIGSGVSRDYCIGADVPIGLSLTDSDCNDSDNHAYQELNYSFRDEDKDNHLIVMPQIQKICAGTSLPNTYLATAQGKWIGDCDDNLATGMNVYRSVELFNDEDRDLFGSGVSQSICIGDTIPEQLSTQGSDCNDTDNQKYQTLSFLYRDVDLDNHLIQLPQPGQICSGENLPSTYLSSITAKWLGDCDDSQATGVGIYRSVNLFVDEDGDSFGAGSVQPLCIGATLPSNLSEQAGDCNDSDGGVFQQLPYNYRDVDLDGHLIQLPQTEQVCSGTNLPNSYFSTAQEQPVDDCADDNNQLLQNLSYEYLDLDLDGHLIQLPQAEQICSGTTLPSGYFATAQDLAVGDCDDDNNQLFQNLSYEYLDLDLDDYLVQLPITDSVCSGANLPNTHLISPQNKTVGDCDDTPENGRDIYRNVDLFIDLDGDDYGTGESYAQCIGANIPDQFSTMGSDCNDSNSEIYQGLSYQYRDRDRDNYLDDTIEAGNICTAGSLPATYFNSTEGKLLGDCDDSPETGSLVYRTLKLFTNLDGDSYGVGSGADYCIGRLTPSGLASLPNDCDDTNRQIYKELSYRYRDADSDLHLVQAPQGSKVCSSNYLPRGFLNNNSWHPIGDCDDSIESGSQVYRSAELFTDLDGDDVGIGAGHAQCIGNDIPDNFSIFDSDCNDNDAAVYRMRQAYIDRDGDKFGFGESQQVCGGYNLPSGYAVNRADCNDDNANVWEIKTAKYQDIDGDGYLSEMVSSIPICTGEALPENYSENKPWRLDCNDDPETGVDVFQQLALFEDLDLDGYGNSTVPLSVQCLGRTLPPGLSRYAGDIDDQDPNVFENVDMAEEELSIILEL
ncbi:MAG: hypothetical protein V7785_20255 [Bermanella sp.]